MNILDELFDIMNESEDDVNVENKIDFVFGSKHPKVNDSKDHFPLKTEKQAKGALAQSNKYKKGPRWFDGSLEDFKSEIVKAIKKEYPSIEI